MFGEDTKCCITILDDDYPGTITYEEKDTVKAPATEEEAFVIVKRVNGSDGVVTVDFETKEMKELGGTAALAGIHYIETNG